MDLKKHAIFLHLGMLLGVIILKPEVLYAGESPQEILTLQEAIEISLKENITIQNAQQDRKMYVLSNKINNFTTWFPQASLNFAHNSNWTIKESTSFFRLSPILALHWQAGIFFDKIYQAKKCCQENVINKLQTLETVSNELQKVVTCYYALVLAQKKWDISNESIEFATATLNNIQEKFKSGMVSKIDLLNASLALKKANLKVLEQKKNLQEKRRDLNFILNRSLNEVILVESDISVNPTWNLEHITQERVISLKTAIQEKQVSIAEAELSNVKISPFTQLNVSGSIASQGIEYDLKKKKLQKTTSNQSLNWNISLDISSLLLLPARIKQAKITLDKAKLSLIQKKLTVADELETKRWMYDNAIAEYKVLAERLEISKHKLLLLLEKYSLDKIFLKKKYHHKRSKLFDLHEKSEQEVEEAELMLVEQAIKVKEAEFALYQLIGMFHI